MTDDEEPSIRNQSLISYAGNLVDAAVSFGGLVLFANALGADGLGSFYTALAAVKVATFPAAGVGQAVQKRGSEYDESPARYLGAGLVLAVGYAAVIGTVVAAGLAVELTAGFTRRAVLAAFAVFTVRLAFLLVNDAYRGQGKTGFATLADNALGIVETVIQIGFVLIGFEVFGLLVGTALATGGAVVVHLAVTSVRIGQPTLNSFRRLVSFARWTAVTAGVSTVYDRLPVFALYAVTTSSVAGYYSAANKLLVLGSYVGGSLAPVLMIRASQKTADETSGDGVGDLQTTLRYAGVIAVPMLFGGVVLAEPLLRFLFGFEGGVVAVVGLGVYHVVNTADTVMYSFIDGIDRPDFTFNVTVGAAVLRGVIIAASVVPFGLGGVVLAVVVSHAAHLVAAQRLLRSEFGQPVWWPGAVYQYGSGAVMAAVVVGFTTVVPADGPVSLVAAVTVGAAVYSVVLLTLDDLLRGILSDLAGSVWRQRTARE